MIDQVGQRFDGEGRDADRGDLARRRRRVDVDPFVRLGVEQFFGLSRCRSFASGGSLTTFASIERQLDDAWPARARPRMSIATSRARRGQRRAARRPWRSGCSSVGENVPLVTPPTCSLAGETRRSLRAARACRPAPARRGAAPARRRRSLTSASRPGNVRSFQVDGEAQPGLERVDLFGQFVAVERHAGFQPQRVAGAQPGRPCRRTARPRSSSASQIAQRGVGRHDQLAAVLARVAGAADDAAPCPAIAVSAPV